MPLPRIFDLFGCVMGIEPRWRDHKGGACPVHEKAMVRVKWANGLTAVQDYRAGGLRWSNTAHPYDIAAYQVTSIEEVERAPGMLA